MKEVWYYVNFYLWDKTLLFKRCPDQIIQRCVPEEEIENILHHYHSSSYEGHFGATQIAAKVLQKLVCIGLKIFVIAIFDEDLWPVPTYVKNISRYHELPLNNILAAEIFDVWEIDFMGPFCSFFSCLQWIMYQSEWNKLLLQKNDAKVVLKSLHRNIFSRFGTTCAIISKGTHFCNKLFENLLSIYKL